MHVADHEDGSNCGVQDPDQDCEEEAGVADLRSLTGSTATRGSNGRWGEYTDRPGRAEVPIGLFHVKLSSPDNVAITPR
jgi:hypothetical protein